MKTTVRWTMLAMVCLTGCTFNRYDGNNGGLFGRNGFFGNLCGRRADYCNVPMTAVPVQGTPMVVGGACCEAAPTCCPTTVTNECCAPPVSSGCCGDMGTISVGSPAVSFGGSSCGCSGGGLSGSPMMQMQQFEQSLYSEPGVTRVLPGPANDPAITGAQMIPTPMYGG